MTRKNAYELIWCDDEDAAKALTTSFVETEQTTKWHELGRTNEIALLLHAGVGTDPTSYDVIVAESFDGGTTYGLLPAINSIAGGLTDTDPFVWQCPGAALGSGYTDEGWLSPPLRVEPGGAVKVWVKRTGGDATTDARVWLVTAEV
jgi:hypothetical protein